MVNNAIALLGLPFWGFGWITGLLARPLWVGFVYGFNFTMMLETKKTENEYLRLAEEMGMDNEP